MLSVKMVLPMSDFECQVSVVIPSHNRKNLLLRLLDALSQQTLPPQEFEVIVVHNYTDDGSREAVLQRIELGSINLSYFRKDYPGPTASRQFGADQAKGKYIAFIDDDCVPQPEWLESGLSKFKNESSGANFPVGLVQGRTLPNPDQPRRFPEKTVLIDKPSIYFETCNIFYSKESFSRAGGFSDEFMDKFYGEDTDLGWKVKNCGFAIDFAPQALVYHEVFHVSLWAWLKEPLYFKNIPYLAKKFPQFRDHMFARYFLNVETASFNLLLVALSLGGYLSTYFLLFTLPYFYCRYQSGAHMPNVLLRIVRSFSGLPRSFFTFIALVSGSLRYKSVLI